MVESAPSDRFDPPCGGKIQAHAQLRGRPRPVNDSWVTARWLVRDLPLATFNIKDYADFAEHEGLEIVH
jgi:toxin FitB